MQPVELQPASVDGEPPAPQRPDAPEQLHPAPRARRRRRTDLYWAAGVCAALVALTVVLRDYLGRPFWYDEIWRGHYVSEPLATFWPELAHANTPSAFGWVVVERLGGDLLGWHTWVLRLPGFVALPLLGAGIVLLVSRFAGGLAGAFAALWVCLNATQLDLGTQLKPYTLEALAAVVAVGLWLVGERGCAEPATLDRGRLARRTLAGAVSLFSVPAIFLIVPLAAADVVLSVVAARRAGRGWFGAGTRRALEALPAVALSVANTFAFVAHQSSQRLGTYWDAQFLAGRGAGAAFAFVGRQLWDTVTGTPPGIDRYDPSLLHAPSDGHWTSAWLLAPAVIATGLIGAWRLARRHDGRLVLGALGGAEVAMLAASAVRFWPFGPTRTNLFVVPLIVLVVVVGAATTIRWAAGWVVATANRTFPVKLCTTTGAVVLVVLVAAGGVGAQVASARKDGRLYAQRDRLRGLDLTVDAAVAARRLYRPGDLVVVGGRLVRPGWIYAVEESDDAPRRPAELPPRPAGSSTEPARIPRADTLFFSALGEGQVASEVAARRPTPRRLLMFVFDLDLTATRQDVADLHRAGWCDGAVYQFPGTGTLTLLNRC